jgi:tRNA threonylcarbamoyladenosine biosynthesis protein TsaB
MKTLFISTYNDLITIGLLYDGQTKTKKEQESHHGHSVYLVPLIDEITKENEITVNDLNEIIVVNGPGSFTGIRLGITVAKTLAYTLNIPIKTITSIEALAASIKETNKIITIDDNKGKYIGIFTDGKLSDDIIYLQEAAAEEFLSKQNYKVYSEEVLDLDRIYEYTKDLKSTNPHAVKAIYIKEIEALNGR